MTILEKIKFEEDWLSEVNLTKENIKIAFAGIRATALDQEPCEDCISRNEAIRIAEQGQIQGFEWQFKKLCKLSSMTPKARWIPVSERLPKDGQKVLTTTLGGDLIGTDTSIFYHASAFWKHYVIAWLPLPQPYKAESEEVKVDGNIQS